MGLIEKTKTVSQFCQVVVMFGEIMDRGIEPDDPHIDFGGNSQKSMEQAFYFLVIDIKMVGEKIKSYLAFMVLYKADDVHKQDIVRVVS